MRDSSGFDEFYSATARQAVAYLYAVTGDLADAEDAVAEAYARAWQRWRRIGTYEDPASWVRRVAYRIAVSAWRRTRNRTTAHRRWGAEQPIGELDPDTVALVALLRQIGQAQRQAIVLHHLYGLTVREIAKETDSSESAVKQRLSRGRQALADLLRAEDTKADDTKADDTVEVETHA